MTKQEFLEKWDTEILDELLVSVGEKTLLPFYNVCFEEGGQWHFGMVGERSDLTVIRSGDEECIFDYLDANVNGLKKRYDRRKRH